MRHVVEAAGGIVYRINADSPGWMKFADDGFPPAGSEPLSMVDVLEVCVVHRPKYDDWSWPKGGLFANESHRHAAVREIGEETGVPVTLGPRLGEVEYPLREEGRSPSRQRIMTLYPSDSDASEADKALKNFSDGANDIKHVIYWMARVISPEAAARQSAAFGPVPSADAHEIDGVVWVSVQRARHLLSHPIDRSILDMFVDRVRSGAAFASTLLIVRHAKAEARKQWQGGEADRPITPKGSAAAYALARELTCYNPTRLVTSPWKRCMETLESFSWQTGIPMVTAEELTEASFGESPQEAWACFEAEIGNGFATHQTTAICMHRPVIGSIFKHLRPMCVSKSLASHMVGSSPYMPTGTAVALHMIGTASNPTIIDIQRVVPLVY